MDYVPEHEINNLFAVLEQPARQCYESAALAWCSQMRAGLIFAETGKVAADEIHEYEEVMQRGPVKKLSQPAEDRCRRRSHDRSRALGNSSPSGNRKGDGGPWQAGQRRLSRSTVAMDREAQHQEDLAAAGAAGLDGSVSAYGSGGGGQVRGAASSAAQHTASPQTHWRAWTCSADRTIQHGEGLCGDRPRFLLVTAGAPCPDYIATSRVIYQDARARAESFFVEFTKLSLSSVCAGISFRQFG